VRTASSSTWLTRTSAPADRLSRTSSESARKRLHAASRAASSSQRTRRAFGSASGLVTATSAVVPIAGNESDVTLMSRRRLRREGLGSAPVPGQAPATSPT